MQAYAGNDGVVISLTHTECEDITSVAEQLKDGDVLSETKGYGEETLISIFDSIAQLKKES